MSDSWSDLQELWRSDATGNAAFVAQVRRLERTRLWSRAVRYGLVVPGLAGLTAAVAHSVTLLEAAAAVVIGITIVAYLVWETIDERRHHAILVNDSSSYLRRRQSQLKAELRILTFTWVVIGAELAFFIPWLFDGIPIHFGSFWSPAALLAWGVPLAGIGTLLTITIRGALRRRRELRRLSAMPLREDSAP